MGVSHHSWTPSGRHFNTAATRSCPSLKMSAETANSWSTTRFSGYRPPSNNGDRFSITALVNRSGEDVVVFTPRWGGASVGRVVQSKNPQRNKRLEARNKLLPN